MVHSTQTMITSFLMNEKGLQNFEGVTCYINSCLQLLFSSTSFMKALESIFELEKDLVSLIENNGFLMATPHFLSVAWYTKRISVYKIPSGTYNSKDDALRAFINVISIRNERFSIASGQQSCAEFLCYLLSLLRKEVLLLKTILRFKQESINHLVLTNIFNNICDRLDKSEGSNEDTPIDDYFLNQIEVSSRCQNCKKSQFHKTLSTFTFEASHRFFMKKMRKLVTTQELINLYLRGSESSKDSDVVIHTTCCYCHHHLGLEELKLKQIAENVIVIYDRIDSSQDDPINTTVLSPLDITALSTKSLCHWYLGNEIQFNQFMNQENTSLRSLISSVFHSGPSIHSGHFITVSMESSTSNQIMNLFNDNEVIENINLFPLFRDPTSNLKDSYGNAVIALYGKRDSLSHDGRSTTSTKLGYSLTQMTTPPKKEKKRSRRKQGSKKQLMRKRRKSEGTRKSKIKAVRKSRQKTKTNSNTTHFTFDSTKEDYEHHIKKGNSIDFTEFQLNPEKAVMMYHFNSGSYAFHNLKDDLSKKSTRDKIIQEIREQVVSKEKKKEIIEMFDTQIYGGVNSMPSLKTCGCCGIREYERGLEKIYSRERGGVRYRKTPLENLIALRYSDRDEFNLRTMLKKGPLSIPINAYYNQQLIVPEEAKSYYLHEKENRYYHLHREFVEKDNKGRAQVQICHDCYYSLFPHETTQTSNNDPQIPEMSIAAGVDFGDLNRIRLTEPNTFERIILSQVRNFITVLKLADNTGQRNNYTQSILKGHAITFDHDAPVIVNSILKSLETASSSFKLHLFCDDGKKDFLFEKIKGSSLILGRPYVIYQWLLVLKRINKFYSSNVIPNINVVHDKVLQANNHVLSTMSICTDENALLDELKEGDDIAEIRTTTKHPENTTNGTRSTTPE